MHAIAKECRPRPRAAFDRLNVPQSHNHNSKGSENYFLVKGEMETKISITK